MKKQLPKRFDAIQYCIITKVSEEFKDREKCLQDVASVNYLGLKKLCDILLGISG